MTIEARRPDFIIIGAQKAGTTTLSRLLSQIDGVFTPHGESPHFESPYFEMGGPRRLFHELARHPAHGIIGVKRPDYLPSLVVPRRVSDLLPVVDVVTVLRDPVKRALSAYLHYAEYNLVPPINPNQGLRRLLAGDDIGTTRGYEILDWGLYTQHLERWASVIPEDRLHVISQPSLLADPQDTLGQLPFLDGMLPTVGDPPHANEGARSVSELKTRSVMHRLLTSQTPDTRAHLPRTTNPVRLGLAGIAREIARIQAKNTKARFNLSPDVREMLEDYYHKEKRELRSRYAIGFE